uniref:ARAD1B02618p n=1 Tax=Blastobotrys adeninivorans TaxID=409370 RepID=A0A060T4U3_BLAAD
MSAPVAVPGASQQGRGDEGPVKGGAEYAVASSKHHGVLYSSPPDTDHEGGGLSEADTIDVNCIGRIIKSGWLQKRSKTTKSWSKRWCVLRDHQFVYYKDEQEYKVLGIVPTADIMSVAMIPDLQKPNRFALFATSGNVHLKAENEADAQQWIDTIRTTASKAAEDIMSSSFRRISILEHPRGDIASHFQKMGQSKAPEGHTGPPPASSFGPSTEKSKATPSLPSSQPDQAQQRGIESQDQGQQDENGLQHDEKIVRTGYVVRKRHRHYAKWTRQWMVLTTRRVLFYKSDKSKDPVKDIELANVIDTTELDGLSPSKPFCMQIITAEKRIRLSVSTEGDLTQWLASFKAFIKPPAH